MLHRLFNGSTHRLSEADLRSHVLLHGENSEQIGSLDEQDVRIIIAQDLGDKAKVVLLDTQKGASEAKTSCLESSARSSLGGHGCKKRPSFPLPKDSTSTPELLTELMFGTVPLSYRGTSVRVHPLSSHDNQESRSFLFTKVFTVNISNPSGIDSPHDDSSTNSLSSSYSSTSGMRNEYPFPMTAITDSRQNTPRERKSRDRAHDRYVPTPGARASDMTFQRQPPSAASRHHQRAASGGARSDLGDAVPHVPFTKADTAHHDDYFSGWLPSPGPVLARRRRSTGTNGSTSPGSVLGRSRYQAAMCAIGVVFTVPGNGQEHSECAVITRYWQMLTRAIYALQRVVYDEVEIALNFVTANGALQTPCSRTQITQKGEAQVYQRGKKLYVALGQNCLRPNQKISSAVDGFRARLAGGINLPEIQRSSLQQEAGLLMEELAHLITQLDRKESKFILFTLLTHLAIHRKAMKEQQTKTDAVFHKNILRDRLVVVSDNAVLARRLIYCIARLFFRGHNKHLRDATDYGLVWPSNGLLHVSRKELIRKRRNQVQSARLTRGWDIPGNHARPLSSGSHGMPPISPSIYHRPPSTTSNASSRGSSWKPSWSWFNNNSRTNLHDDNRSDTRTMQTSWTSADFAELVSSRKSPRSFSPGGGALGRGSPASPGSDGNVTENDEDDEDGGDSIETTVPALQLGAYKDDDGTINVSMLQTVTLNKDSGMAEPTKLDQAEAELPLTGVLSRFHPDMLVQAIPSSALYEREMKDYLVEEDLYIPQSLSTDSAAVPGASVTIVELGSGWRLRRLTRLSKAISEPSSSAILEESETDGHHNQDATAAEATHTTYEESWSDEILVDLSEPLRRCVLQTIHDYKTTNDPTHVQKMIDALVDFPMH